MTIALPCCRGRWLGGYPPCSVYTVPCRPCSGRKMCRSPSSRTPLSPTPATASRAPASTAWGLQGRWAVSKAAGRRAPPLLCRLYLSPSLPISTSLPSLPLPLPSPSSIPPPPSEKVVPSQMVLPECPSGPVTSGAA